MAACASLPAELLTLILALLPRHPRLVVASLVCKRWRSVLRTITTIPWGRRQTQSPECYMIQLLPNLTGIELTDGAFMARPLRSIEALRATANLAPLQQMLCTFSATLESLAFAAWSRFHLCVLFRSRCGELPCTDRPAPPLGPSRPASASPHSQRLALHVAVSRRQYRNVVHQQGNSRATMSLSREIAIHQENLATLLRHTPQLCELSL